MTKAIFFDLDGTLADTAPDLGYALNQLLQKQGRQPLALKDYRPYVSAGTRGMLWIGFGIKPEDYHYEHLKEQFLAFYETRLCAESTLFPGIRELLIELMKRGLISGIVTNKPKKFTEPLVKMLGVSDQMAVIISGDSAARPKPAPDPLLLAASVIGVQPNSIIYVGDDMRDIMAARAAGMYSVAASYGYLGKGTEISDWKADAIIGHPSQLLDLLS